MARRAEVKPDPKCNHDLEWSLLKMAQCSPIRMAVVWSDMVITILLALGEGMATSNTFFGEKDIGKLQENRASFLLPTL